MFFLDLLLLPSKKQVLSQEQHVSNLVQLPSQDQQAQIKTVKFYIMSSKSQLEYTFQVPGPSTANPKSSTT